MQNIVNFLNFPILLIILAVIIVVIFLFRMIYTEQTKELSVNYAKIVLKKYKDSRSKTISSMHEYLFVALLADYPREMCHKIEKRIFKNWFKSLSREDIKLLKNYHNLKRKQFIYNDMLWFTNIDKTPRMYFLKKVILKNSK